MIRDLYAAGKPVVSFEVFPPKRDADIAAIYEAVGRLSGLRPDFISVTYGAAGERNQNRTGEIAAHIAAEYRIPALAHLTCVSTPRAQVHAMLDEWRCGGVRDVLALRGDPPAGGAPECAPAPGGYRYAADLIADIKARGDFCVGAACYPEGHIDANSPAESIEHLLHKQEAGADFFVSQLFFENDLFWRFLEAARRRGVARPISAGVMPLLSRGQIERMIFLCGASLPAGIIRLLHKYEQDPAALQQAGIEYAAAQMEQLAQGGADGVHVYTMNRPAIATAAMARLGRMP